MKKEKLHWFLLEEDQKISEQNKFIFIDKNLLHQFNRVLKFKNGEQIIIFNGKGTVMNCEIEDLKKNECLIKVLEKTVTQEKKNKQINLFFGIPKKNKLELIIEKGTEVGVSSFNPIVTQRTAKQNSIINEDRLKKILVEATEQSENSFLPQMNTVSTLDKVIQNLNPKNTFVFHTKGELLNICDLKFFSETNIIIGPEGGWAEEEPETLKDKKFSFYKVGEGVLKTETAAIVIPFLFLAN